MSKTVEELMKRAEANNDAAATFVLGSHYYRGLGGLQQDHPKAMELCSRAAELGCSAAHNNLAGVYHEWGDMKKAKFHLEAAAIAGHEVARNNLGIMEDMSRNREQAVKHWMIAASAGCYRAMHELVTNLGLGRISRE